jgi:Fe-S-cluster containining protein
MSPCAGCHAGCCRAFAVPVTGADILRIERELGWSFWDFVCRWEDRDGAIAGEMAPQFYFDDEPETPFAICLLQNASRNFPATSKCRFLMEEPPTKEHPLGTAQCGIYGVRPGTCRAFPTRFHPSGLLVSLHEVPERGRPAEQGEAYRLCPRPWEPAEVDPISAPQDLVVLRYEMQFFAHVAEVWNQSPGLWADFPEFLRLVYANRVQGAERELRSTLPQTRAA